MPDVKGNAIEWGVMWPDGQVRWVPGGEQKAREMAASKGGQPFRRVRTSFYDDVTEWREVTHA